MTLHLKPEIEAKLTAYAAAHGVSVDAYVDALVEEQVRDDRTATVTVDS